MPEINGRNETGRAAIRKKAVLLAFSLGALIDFGWAMFAHRSILESLGSAILGLFGTGWYLLLMWGSSRNDPDRWQP